MPSRRNPVYRGYNDPGIAQGFANIADIFKPPSGTDLYGYSKANETNQKMARVAELYAAVKDPNYNKEVVDRQSVIAGLYNPNQSYYSVDQGNKVERDKFAAANATDLEKARLQQSGETTRTMLAPVGQGATRFVPPSVASLYGVPQTQVGVINAGRGDTVVTPDNRTIMGAPVPLTESEKKAQIIGGMTPAEQQAIAFGTTPIETVRGADGKATPMTRPQQLAQGLPSVSDKPAQIFNYKLPDQAGRPGMSGTAMYDPISGGLVDSQTRQPIPAGAQTYTAQLTGSKADTGLGPTTANQTTANNREANLTVLRNLVEQFDTLLANNPGVIGIPGTVRGAAQDLGSVATEFAQAFGGLAPDAALTAEQVRAAASTLAPSRDPAIQQARLMASDLAYKYAQAQNPSGEVSRQAFERSLEALTGGMLRNNQSARESLAGMRQFIDREAGAVQSLRAPGSLTAPGATPAAPATPGAPERWERDPATGQLRKVQ